MRSMRIVRKNHEQKRLDIPYCRILRYDARLAAISLDKGREIRRGHHRICRLACVRCGFDPFDPGPDIPREDNVMGGL